jgi:hypothetical protein
VVVTHLGTARALEPAPPPPDSSGDTAACAEQDATSSLPERTRIGFKPAYTFPNGSLRYKAELLFEPVLPYHGFLIPDLEVPGFWSLARLQLAALNQQNSQGVASGLGDLTLLDLVAHEFGPLRAGLGFATIFPMATNPALGQGKWQVGPAAALELQGIPHLKLAVLAENFYSVAGSNQSPSLGYVVLQPFVTVYLPAEVFVSTDAAMNFYWNGGKTSVPVDLGLGRAFSAHFVGTLQGWYWVAGSGQGDLRARAVLNFLP